MNATDSKPLPPPPPALRLTASHKALWGLVILLLAAKLVETIVHVPFHNASQQAIFSWKSVAFFVVLALTGSGFAHVATFPGMWAEKLRVRQKVWTPLVVGIVLGVGLLALDRASGFGHLFAAANGVSSLSLPLPYAIFFQVYAAICAAVLYNLFALSFTVWFFGTLLLARRWPSPTFWVMATLVSLWQPFTMASQHHWAIFHLEPISAGIVGILVLVYVLNLSAAVLLRRFGFTAALVMWVSANVVWHIIGKF